MAYNAVSALLWLNILALTLNAVITHPPATSIISSKSTLGKLFGAGILPPQPSAIGGALERLRNNYTVGGLGTWVKWTQTLALLEIVHSALGWVRSPLATTGAQVASRIYTVWGVVEAVPKVSSAYHVLGSADGADSEPSVVHDHGVRLVAHRGHPILFLRNLGSGDHHPRSQLAPVGFFAVST